MDVCAGTDAISSLIRCFGKSGRAMLVFTETVHLRIPDAIEIIDDLGFPDANLGIVGFQQIGAQSLGKIIQGERIEAVAGDQNRGLRYIVAIHSRDAARSRLER